jgi:predicted enzyme related to lactoylglutathione lyase
VINGIVDVAIVVSDSKKALKWYTEVLGLEPRDTRGHRITVAPEGSKTVLHLCQSKNLEKGNTGIALSTKDIEKTYERLRAKGVKFRHPPIDEGWGVFAQFEDPDGNVIWLNPA